MKSLLSKSGTLRLIIEYEWEERGKPPGGRSGWLLAAPPLRQHALGKIRQDLGRACGNPGFWGKRMAPRRRGLAPDCRGRFSRETFQPTGTEQKTTAQFSPWLRPYGSPLNRCAICRPIRSPSALWQDRPGSGRNRTLLPILPLPARLYPLTAAAGSGSRRRVRAVSPWKPAWPSTPAYRNPDWGSASSSAGVRLYPSSRTSPWH